MAEMTDAGGVWPSTETEAPQAASMRGGSVDVVVWIVDEDPVVARCGVATRLR